CRGPRVRGANPDGGFAGRGGGPGAAGTAGGSGSTGTAGGSGAVGTGGAVTGTGGGRGGQGGTAGTSANACSRCETPCKDGVCDLALIRSTASSSIQSSATSVALNDGRLYFAVGPGVEGSSIAAAGGPEMELYPYHDCPNCLLSVAVDDADVFFAGQNVAGTNSILAVPKTGGGAVRTVCMTPQAIPGELTLEGDFVYYVRVDT